MEHRHYPRTRTGVGVEVFRGLRQLGYFKTRDISLEGMFIETGNVGLSRNDIVRLRLEMTDEEISARGIVVHASKEGIGIQFIDANLRRLFEDPQVAGRSVLANIRSNASNRQH